MEIPKTQVVIPSLRDLLHCIPAQQKRQLPVDRYLLFTDSSASGPCYCPADRPEAAPKTTATPGNRVILTTQEFTEQNQ